MFLNISTEVFLIQSLSIWWFSVKQILRGVSRLQNLLHKMQYV